MEHLLKFTLIVCLCGVAFTNLRALETYTSEETYLPHITSLLNYVNNQPDQTHFFHFQALLSAQKEEDGIIKLIVDVKGECKPEILLSSCTPAVFTCQGVVQSLNGNVETRPGIICQPKVVLYDQTTTSTTNIISSTDESSQISFNEEPTQSNKPTEAVVQQTRVPCLGCPFDLNLNVQGIDTLVNTALRHVESEHTRRLSATRVLRVQQQIVAGVKYIVVLEIAPTVCSKDASKLTFCPSDSNLNTEVCEVSFYQRPWISKKKDIISNNCTVVQEFAGLETSRNDIRNDENNDLHIVNGVTTENIEKRTSKYSPGRTVNLLDLESQIVFEPIQERRAPVSNVVSTIAGNVKGEEVEIRQLSTIQNSLGTSTIGPLFSTLDEDAFYQGDQPHDSNDSSDNSDKCHHQKGKDSSDSSDSSDDHHNCRKKSCRHKKDTSENDDKNDCKKDVKRCKKDKNVSLESGTSNDTHHKKHKEEDSDSSDECRKKNRKGKKGSSDSDDSDSDDCRHKHKKAKKQNCDDDSSSSSSSSSEECEKQKKSKRRKRSSNYLTKLNNDDKVLIKNLAGIALDSINESNKEYAEQLISHVLDVKKKVLTKGIEYQLILKVSASQCPSNALPCPENLDALSKLCKVNVLINEEKDYPQILKSKCENDKNNPDELKNDNNVRNKREARKTPRLGGVNRIPNDDQEIRDLTEHALQYYDAQTASGYKHKVLNIIEASKQLVAGTLHRIKAEIILSDCLLNSAVQRENCNPLRGSESYICNIKVWNQPWLPNGRETNITCHINGLPQKYSFRSKRETNLHYSYKLLNDNDHPVTLETFKQFVKAYGKTYENKEEFKKRYHVFRQNMKKVRLFNKYEEGTAKYGATQFADLTEKEFKKFLGLKPELRNENNIVLPQAQIPNIDIPPEFDWRTKNVVAEVKNQGACGSCWAFSVTGNVEGQYALKYGKLLEFSEQELVDCDSTDEGCSGGLMDNAYLAIEKLGGLETEQDYPYEAENEKCHFNRSLVQVKVKGALNISQDETDMAKWLVKNGPISIAINANAMQFYFGGVSHPWKMLCNPQGLDHGVLIVGYGVHKYPYLNKTLPYWIVKNSWGKSWGQQGYYLVYRGDGTCGLNQEPTSAIIE